MDRLPHTFDALLSRFGRLTEIQALALEPLLAGRNCVLAAATASGKTEAALAPMLERDLRQRLKENSRRPAQRTKTKLPRVLYIVPTRALARDMARRLEQPFKKLAISMAVKTGDEPTLNWSRPPEFLITTPESLDSLLANKPRLLCDVRAVVLDELHLYDNTPRGDQLRILLNRLRRIRTYACSRGDAVTDEVQFCALSATMQDALLLASRYFVNPVLIESEGQRALNADLRPLTGPQSLRQLFATLRERGRKKVLAFCRRRHGSSRELEGARPPRGGRKVCAHRSRPVFRHDDTRTRHRHRRRGFDSAARPARQPRLVSPTARTRQPPHHLHVGRMLLSHPDRAGVVSSFSSRRAKLKRRGQGCGWRIAAFSQRSVVSPFRRRPATLLLPQANSQRRV